MTPEQHREQAEQLLASAVWGESDDDAPRTPEVLGQLLHAAQIHAAIYAADVQREMAAGVRGALGMAQAEAGRGGTS